MRRRAVGLLVVGLALAGLLAFVGASHAASPDVVAAEPREGDRGHYEGYERTVQPGGEVANRSLEHTSTWTLDGMPMPDGSRGTFPTLVHRHPLPDVDEGSQAAMPSQDGLPRPFDALAVQANREGPSVASSVVRVDVRHHELPGRPTAFSVVNVDQHEEGRFWRVFRLHGFAGGWCAQAPTGSFVGLSPASAREAVEGCLHEVPWGDAETVTLDTGFEEHPEAGLTWVLEAEVTYRAPGGPAEANLLVRTSPAASLPLELRIERVETGPEGPVEHVRHAELTGYERGDEPLPDREAPEPTAVETTRWTREGPQTSWDAGLSFGEARERAREDPRAQGYRDENPEARLNYAQYLLRHADERSTSPQTAANLGHCENERAPQLPSRHGPREVGWYLFYSGESEDMVATVDRVDDRQAPETPVDQPARTGVSRFASSGLGPGLDLPREGPAPRGLLDHLDAVDALQVEGDPYLAVFAPGEEGTTSDPAGEPLMGSVGRFRCAMDPATQTYSATHAGIVFVKGEAAGVYTLRIESLGDGVLAPQDLEDPPAAEVQGDDGLAGTGLSGLAVAATGAVGLVGARALGSLYSRIRNRELLDHEVRSAVHEHVHETPGVRLSELADAIDRHRSTVNYHLERLEEAGFVTSQVTDSGRIVFPADHPLVDAAEALARSRARELVGLVREDPGRHVTSYADELGVSKSYVSRLTGELADAELVDRRREGRTLRLEPGPRAEDLDA